MGLVYLCLDTTDDSPVAAKTLKPEFAREKAIRDRFLQEALIWIRLGRHANVVSAMSAEVIDHQPFILVEYVPGGDLRRQLKAGLWTAVETARVGTYICRAMAHAVSVIPGFVHRDLKPENILLTADRIPKVTDFGIAVNPDAMTLRPAALNREPLEMTTPLATKYGVQPGTPLYMAPEQLNHRPVDLRTDIFALGLICFEMLWGRGAQWPPDATKWPNSTLRVAAPSPLVKILRKCLQVEPAMRFQSWEDASYAFEECFQGLNGLALPNPGEAEVESWELISRGLSLWRLGRADQALDCYDDPRINREAVYWSNRGNFLHSLGRSDEALQSFDQALACNGRYAPAWNNRGMVLAETGDLQGAISSYDRALAIDPGYLDALGNKAADLGDLGRHEESIALCQEGLRHDPDHLVLLSAQANAMSRLGRVEEAFASYDRILELDPWHADTWVNKANQLGVLGKHDEAVGALDRLLEFDPRSVVGWCAKSIALSRAGRHNQAGECVQKALEIDRLLAARYLPHLRTEIPAAKVTKHALSMMGRGASLQLQGRLGEAIACFREAVNLDGSRADARALLGACLKAAGNFEEALGCLEDALQLDPNNTEALLEKGAILCDVKQEYSAAMKCFEHVLRLAPSNVHALHNKGVTLLGLDQFPDARACFEEAIRNDPYHVNAWYNLGVAFYNEGEKGQCIRCLQKATQLGSLQAADLLSRLRKRR